jgi:putative ABC transport system substrate-binding protein
MPQLKRTLLAILISSTLCAQATENTKTQQNQPDQSHRINPKHQNTLVIIDSEPGEPFSSVNDAMLHALADAGYTEGSNLKIHYASLDNFEGRADSLWQLDGYRKHELFFVNGTVAAGAFQKLAFNDHQHRFVFCAVTDPVGMGLLDNFSTPPKANFTGVSYPVPVKLRFHFIKRLFPAVKKIGLIYADMPQSHSYRRWVENLLKTDDEFKGIEVIFRMVPFVRSNGGHIRMSILAEQFVKELDDQVDLFVTPNDQMGAQAPFARMVFKSATKPLIGLGAKDVMDGWGATASIAPSLQSMGKQAALMVKQLLEGKTIKQIMPEQTTVYDISIDVAKAKSFGAELSPQLLKDAGSHLIHP